MKLKQKLTFTFLVAVFIPVAIGMYAIVHEVKNSMILSGKEISTGYVSVLAERMTGYFDKWKGISDTLSRFDFIKEKDWEKLDPVFQEITDENPEVTDFVITNPDGSYWYGAVPGNPYKNYLVTDDRTDPNSPLKYVSALQYQQELVVKNTNHERKTIVTDPYISVAQKLRLFCIASTIIDDGKVAGVVGVAADASAIGVYLQHLLVDFEKDFGKEARLIITAGEKDVLVNYLYDEAAGEFIDNASAMNEIKDVSILSAGFNAALQKFKTSDSLKTTYQRDDGKECFLTGIPIEGTSYKIYITVPLSKLIERSRKILNIIIVIAIILGTIIISVAIFVSSKISGSITKASRKLDDLSSGAGDLTVHIDANGNDEMSDMNNHFNVFISNLREMIKNIITDTAKLRSVSSNLDVGVSDIKADVGMISDNVFGLNEKAKEQTASVSETAASVEQIAKRLDDLSSSVNAQTNAVSNSSSAIEEMVENINSIADNLEKASKRFDELHVASTTGKTNIANVQALVTAVSEQSSHLLDTNKLINAIANQTNLLAMNAAIEAAHAGDAGRGFSVVASEIRKLAEDSSKQSKTIADELQSIVTNITEIVDATAKAGSSFDIVVTQVQESSQIVEDISVSLKEQSMGNKHVLEDLVNIQNTTEDVRDGSIEMKNGIESILKETKILTDISTEVKDISSDISKTLSSIGIAIDMVKENSIQNASSVDSLAELTNKFKV